MNNLSQLIKIKQDHKIFKIIMINSIMFIHKQKHKCKSTNKSKIKFSKVIKKVQEKLILKLKIKYLKIAKLSQL
jgi:hypothetical protein